MSKKYEPVDHMIYSKKECEELGRKIFQVAHQLQDSLIDANIVQIPFLLHNGFQSSVEIETPFSVFVRPNGSIERVYTPNKYRKGKK